MIGGILAALARLVAGSSVQWVAAPRTAEPCVYIANHSSHLDFIVLWSYLPAALRRRTRPVAARDYWVRGRLRRYLAEHVFHAVLIDRVPRGDASGGPGGAELGRAAVMLMGEALERGYSLIVFPEGTRGAGERLGPFRSGLYHLCLARSSLDVVPVYMDNLNRILPKGHLLPVPMLSRITFGAPTRLRPAEDKAAFLERARQAVQELAPA
jgi:1-acyl-sn-glycerol-3-phosphate acyltransferase